MSTRKPLIGIPADRRLLGDHYFHCVGEKYIRAVAEGAGAVPVLIPSLGDAVDTCEVLSDFDAILLTGSVSNVEPQRYSGLAVQWHPEWQLSENPFSSALFAAFGQAARERALRHRV